ncbi:MAG: hypothetical protein M1837_006263 [Sclerophora amabilis]|nr:MAG: hypothetical protein M1837_006263 [Sclerophora amabilis]
MPRRRTKGSDVFVACYSAILASATLADAKLKEDRRKEWDRVIGESQQDLRRQKGTDGDEGARVSKSPRGLYKIRHVTWADTLAMTARDLEARKDFEVLPEQDAIVCGNPATPVPERTARYQRMDNHPTARPLTGWKLCALEKSIAKLVARLITQVPECLGEKEAKSATRESAFTIERQILIDRLVGSHQRLLRMLFETTHSGLRRFPAYKDGHPPPSTRRPHELNESLQSIVEESGESSLDIRLTIAKICQNLLVTPTAPDAITFDIILKYLLRFKMDPLIKVVLDSMFESRLMPNEAVLAKVLKFYANRKDLQGFNQFVRLMRGLDGGLGSARRRKRLLQSNPELLSNKGRFFHRDGKIIERAPRDQRVFKALIDGALKFNLVRRAMTWYRALIHEGWEVNVQVLTSIIQDCTRRRDWLSGQAIWQEMKDLVWRSGQDAQVSLDWNAYYSMLILCQACRKNDVFCSLYEEAQQHGFLNSKASDPSLSEKQKMRDWRKFALVDFRARAIEHAHQVETVDRALYVSGSHLERMGLEIVTPRSVQLRWDALTKTKRRRRIRMLQHVLDTEDSRIRDLSAQVVAERIAAGVYQEDRKQAGWPDRVSDGIGRKGAPPSRALPLDPHNSKKEASPSGDLEYQGQLSEGRAAAGG